MLSASYVLYYYQDIMGVSAVAMGIILFIARIFDAFNDPIMGIIVAKTKTKWGKFRPWLFVGTLTNAIILYLMFSAPPTLNGGGLVAYAAVTYILWGVTYTMMDIPYWSMIPAFTKAEKKERIFQPWLVPVPEWDLLLSASLQCLVYRPLEIWLGEVVLQKSSVWDISILPWLLRFYLWFLSALPA